jgi:hypothetical protein
MKIDKDIQATGGGLHELSLEFEEVRAELDDSNLRLGAIARPNTVSISAMHIDSGDVIDVPEPPDDAFLYNGHPSRHFGLGGAPPYLEGYPIGGNGLTVVTGYYD